MKTVIVKKNDTRLDAEFYSNEEKKN